jgi:hypothetical protein
LDFVAAGIDSSSQPKVVPVRSITEGPDNPNRVLTILVDAPAPAERIRVFFQGHEYSVRQTDWDRMAFRLLYQLFQITVQKVSGMGAPAITISK